MANEYYTASGAPATRSQGSSNVIRGEYNLLVQAFDKLPTLAGNGGKIVRVNSGGSALEASTALGSSITATDYGSVDRRVGWVQASPAAISSNTTLALQHLQNITPVTATATVTLPNIGDIAVQAQFIVENGATLNLVGDTGITVEAYVGAGAINNPSFEGEAVVCAHKRSATKWIAWGNGVS